MVRPPQRGRCRLQGHTLRDHLRRLFSEWEWQRRFATYQVKIANSHFTREYARRWWGLDCQVVYPPAGGDFERTDKADAILSVGRFATLGHSKKQLEMMAAFRRLECVRLSGWEYLSVGSLGTRMRMPSISEKSGAQPPAAARVLANVDRMQLKRFFERSKIFWHAAGYGEDETLRPQFSEHFGIVTVEAMSAGCVPVVINKGGQSEIVDHGVSGFLWNTLEEMMDYTAQLKEDNELRQRDGRNGPGARKPLRQAAIRGPVSRHTRSPGVEERRKRGEDGSAHSMSSETANVFSKIYSSHEWGGKSRSGPGSDPALVQSYLSILKSVIATNNVLSVVDIGCGDSSLSRTIDWRGIDYTGSIVPGLVDILNLTFSGEHVRFVCADLVRDELPGGDLCVVKDVLQHLSIDRSWHSWNSCGASISWRSLRMT